MIERVLRRIYGCEDLLPETRHVAGVLLHKLMVYEEGRKLGLGHMRLLRHDWQKFTPQEFGPYVDRFFWKESPRKGGGYDPTAQGAEFSRAWLHHFRYGSHHWQFFAYPQCIIGRYCIIWAWLAKIESLLATRRCAKTAESTDRYPSSCTEGCTEKSAGRITKNTEGSGTRNTGIGFESGTRKTTQKEPSSIDSMPGVLKKHSNAGYLLLILRTLLAANVAGSQRLSSCVSIILTMMGESTVRRLVAAEQQFLDGRRRTIILPESSQSYVTTVILQNITMGLVRTKPLNEKPDGNGGLQAVEMPWVNVIEMIADWRGAARTYQPETGWQWSETVRWWNENRRKMVLHPETESRVESLLYFPDYITDQIQDYIADMRADRSL